MAAAETRMPTKTKALAEREASMDGKVGYHGPMKHKGLRVRKESRPITVNGKVPPRRVANASRRPREYLTPEEVDRLIAAARKRTGARNPHRDATMILLAYRHGLRASELCALRWDMLDLAQGRYHVTRRKNGRPSVHLIRGTEIRDLRRLKREQVPESVYAFTSERRGPMTLATFRKMLATVGSVAGLPFPVHAYMLRHACGYKLAHDGHDTRALQEWLGHSSIQNTTTKYTELTSRRFKDFWQQNAGLEDGQDASQRLAIVDGWAAAPGSRPVCRQERRHHDPWLVASRVLWPCPRKSPGRGNTKFSVIRALG
jgi:integrase